MLLYSFNIFPITQILLISKTTLILQGFDKSFYCISDYSARLVEKSRWYLLNCISVGYGKRISLSFNEKQ